MRRITKTELIVVLAATAAFAVARRVSGIEDDSALGWVLGILGGVTAGVLAIVVGRMNRRIDPWDKDTW